MRAVAKLSRPRLPAIHAVARLLAQLDRARRSPLVWIAAPPGAGKTTLAASYLEARRIPSVWYRVDEGDGDVATFFHYLGLAMKRAVPRARALPVFAPEYGAAIGPFARRFFRAVWGYLGKRVLVFDDFQNAPPDSAFQEVVRAAVTELPLGSRFFIASRTMPPPGLARLVAQGAVSVVPPRELKLTLREVAGLARARGVKLATSAAARLHRLTNGWASGVVLMLADGHRGEDVALPEHRAPAELFDFFASEVFDRSPETVRRVLLETALLPLIPGEAVDELTSVPGARRVLARMARAGYFTERLKQREEVYGYHPLFRQFLLERGEEVLEPDRRSRLRNEAARVLASAGDTDAAADLLRAAGAWEELGRFIVAQAPQLAAQARLQTLASWIASLPQELLDRQPWLLYWRGQACVIASPGEGRGYLERAFQLFFDGGDAAGAYLAWSGITYSHLCEWGDLRPLDCWIEILEDLRRRWPEAPTSSIEASVVAGAFTALMYRQPNHPDMEAWRERARRVALGPGDMGLRRMVGAALVHFEVWRPDYREAQTLVDALAPSADCARSDPAASIQWFLYRAIIATGLADGTGALQAVDEGLALAGKAGLRQWEVHLRTPAIWAHLLHDDLQRAQAVLRAFDAMLDRRLRVTESSYEAMASFTALRAGEHAGAVGHAERAMELARACGGPFWIGLAEAALAAARLAVGQPQLAHGIASGRPYAHPPFWNWATILVSELAASDALRRGDHDLAATFLGRAFGIAARAAQTANPLLGRRQHAALCAFALEHGIEPEHARALVFANRLVAPEDATVRWPWRLHVRTLGGFEVEIDGEQLLWSRKSPRKTLELLQALIALGPHGASRSRLADALWPSSDGDAAQHALETALYRLRKFLPDVLLQRDGTLSLDLGRCWVDLDAFGRLAKRASTLARQPGEALVTLVEKALEVYRGPFLPAQEHPWVLATREQARRSLRRLVALAAERMRDTGREASARELWLRATRIDPGLESRLSLASA